MASDDSTATQRKRPGRPRKTDTGLPPCVYFRHNAYYLVKKGKWTRLGPDREPAIAMAHAEQFPVEAYVLRQLQRIRSAAKHRGIEWRLTREDVVALVRQAKGRCMMTGTPFSFERLGKRRPYAPSIDRIDSAGHYTPDNCRIVCAATNIALNSWGDEILIRLASHLALKQAKEMRR